MDEDDFVEAYRALGANALAKKLNTNVQSLRKRRARVERKLGITIEGPQAKRNRGSGYQKIPAPRATHRIELNIPDGIVLVASDAHYWPGEVTLMHKALLAMCKEMRPKAIILNGDVMDLPRASRHAAIGWEKRPEIHEEIEWAQEKTYEIALACGRGTRKIWTMGNHDARFESRLANLAPEYAKVHGVHLKDHFPTWEPAWSTYINNDTLIKHRFRGGIHKVHNNLLWTGGNIVTGHVHSPQVLALTYYNDRTIWGMDSGMLGDPGARTFVDYTEDSPKNWRSAFGVLTFVHGRLLQPELVLKWDDSHIQFRGKIIPV